MQQEMKIAGFPEQEQLKCPRCDSNKTKFCYYNNYNLSQPRHFCKNCRRYWTKGGALRNIPVGGGNRKTTKRSSPSKRQPNADPLPLPQQNSASDADAEPTPMSVLPVDHQDIQGSFCPLLATNGQFGNGLDSDFKTGECVPSSDAKDPGPQ